MNTVNRKLLEALKAFIASSYEQDGGGEDIVITTCESRTLAINTIAEVEARCAHCHGTGDIHRSDGEWLGECISCAPPADNIVLNTLRIVSPQIAAGDKKLHPLNDEKLEMFNARFMGESAERVQWLNIQHVVKTLADWTFGSKDDPRWGSAWLAMVTGLTAKDGPELKLKPLPQTQQSSQAEIEARALEEAAEYIGGVNAYCQFQTVEHYKIIAVAQEGLRQLAASKRKGG